MKLKSKVGRIQTKDKLNSLGIDITTNRIGVLDESTAYKNARKSILRLIAAEIEENE